MSEYKKPEGVQPTTTIHERLVWSWNVGIAEDMHEDTIRHNAQWIAAGIGRGEDQDECDLIADFVMRRCTDADAEGHTTIDEEWRMEGPTDQRMLQELVDKEVVCEGNHPPVGMDQDNTQ